MSWVRSRVAQRGLGVIGWLALLSLLLSFSTSASAGTITIYASGTGDGTRWDDSYGWLDHSYHTDETILGTQRQYWQPGWGAHYIYFEIPLDAVAGATISQATLQLESLGFGTGYWYGSASVRHLNGSGTGNIAVDQPHTWGADASWYIFNTDSVGGSPGLKQFDVTTAVLGDLAAGRVFSSFMMEASRDTQGNIYASEYGEGTQGPRICFVGDIEEVSLPAVDDPVPAPEPTTIFLVGSGIAGLFLRRRTG